MAPPFSIARLSVKEFPESTIEFASLALIAPQKIHYWLSVIAISEAVFKYTALAK